MFYSFVVGNIKFNIWHSKSFLLTTNNTASFSVYENFNGITVDLHLQLVDILPQIGEEVFKADSSDEMHFQNIWRIHTLGQQIAYSITYLNNKDYKKIAFIPREEKNIVDVFVVTLKQNKNIKISTFLHPLGILLVSCMQTYFGGLLIHASGVMDYENGYLFTGVSGIGKSTMASIWQRNGALIVNDDRLMLYKEDNSFYFANTPMPYYNDISKRAPLKAIFLLAQSSTNYCTKITGAKALSKVMANFIQQLYNEKLVEIHLDKAMDLVMQVPVYELGFKPDDEIVDLVRSLKF